MQQQTEAQPVFVVVSETFEDDYKRASAEANVVGVFTDEQTAYLLATKRTIKLFADDERWRYPNVIHELNNERIVSAEVKAVITPFCQEGRVSADLLASLDRLSLDLLKKVHDIIYRWYASSPGEYTMYASCYGACSVTEVARMNEATFV